MVTISEIGIRVLRSRKYLKKVSIKLVPRVSLSLRYVLSELSLRYQ